VGDFTPDPARPGGWIYDPDAPTPNPDRGQEPAISMLGPLTYGGAVDWPRADPTREFTRADGSTYLRADPDEFDSFDDVDSTTIVDHGAPD
jgi:hypothetical protein